MRRDSFRFRVGLLAFVLGASLALATAAVAAREPQVHALVGARIVTAPGQVIEAGTLVVRDGLIEAVGADVEPPADARIWELDGLTLYPGLIESFQLLDWPAADDEDQQPQGGHANALVQPERDMLRHAFHGATFSKLREAGFTTAVLVPRAGLFRGQSVLTNLGEAPLHSSVLRRGVAQNARLMFNSDFDAGYPSSTMGAVALFRQTLLDARWHASAQAAFEKNPKQQRPPFSTALAALEEVARGEAPIVLESNDLHDTLRLAGLIEEFGLDAVVVGTGREYQRLDEVTGAGLKLILPIDFPKAPAVKDEDDLSITLERLRHWDRAPDNPRHLSEAGVDYVLTSAELSEPKKIHAQAATAIARGLEASEALAALTTRPAARLGIADRAGTLEVGKMANVVVTDGDLFAEDTAVRSVWIDGQRFEIKEVEPPTVDPLGTWEVTAVAPDGNQTVTLVLTGTVENLEGSIGTPAGSLPISDAYVSGDKVEITFDATPLGMPGNISFSMTIDGDNASGSGSTPAGPFTLSAERTAKPDPPETGGARQEVAR